MGRYFFSGTQSEWGNLIPKEKIQYQLISIGGDSCFKERIDIIKTKYTHCKCCGAPINPYKEKCDYCGVYYTKEI